MAGLHRPGPTRPKIVWYRDYSHLEAIQEMGAREWKIVTFLRPTCVATRHHGKLPLINCFNIIWQSFESWRKGMQTNNYTSWKGHIIQIPYIFPSKFPNYYLHLYYHYFIFLRKWRRRRKVNAPINNMNIAFHFISFTKLTELLPFLWRGKGKKKIKKDKEKVCGLEFVFSPFLFLFFFIFHARTEPQDNAIKEKAACSSSPNLLLLWHLCFLTIDDLSNIIFSPTSIKLIFNESPNPFPLLTLLAEVAVVVVSVVVVVVLWLRFFFFSDSLSLSKLNIALLFFLYLIPQALHSDWK